VEDNPENGGVGHAENTYIGGGNTGFKGAPHLIPAEKGAFTKPCQGTSFIFSQFAPKNWGGGFPPKIFPREKLSVKTQLRVPRGDIYTFRVGRTHFFL